MKLNEAEIRLFEKLVMETEATHHRARSGQPGSADEPLSLAKLVSERRERLKR